MKEGVAEQKKIRQVRRKGGKERGMERWKRKRGGNG